MSLYTLVLSGVAEGRAEGVVRAALVEIIGGAVRKKNSSLGGHKDLTALSAATNRPMILIGG